MGLPCKFAQTLLIIHRAFGMLLLKEQGLRTKDPALAWGWSALLFYFAGRFNCPMGNDEDPKGITNH